MSKISPQAIESYRQDAKTYSYSVTAPQTITLNTPYIIYKILVSGLASGTQINFLDQSNNVIDSYIVNSLSETTEVSFSGIFPVSSISVLGSSSGTIELKMTPLPIYYRNIDLTSRWG
jgi:hypothetical protein